VVPIAVGGIVGGVVLIAAAGLFAWLRRRSLRRASDSTRKLTTPPCTEPGASLDQSDASSAVNYPTQESQSSVGSGSQTPMAMPAQPGSNTVRLDILDLEPDEIAAAASTSRPPSRATSASIEPIKLEHVQKLHQEPIQASLSHPALYPTRAFDKPQNLPGTPLSHAKESDSVRLDILDLVSDELAASSTSSPLSRAASVRPTLTSGVTAVVASARPTAVAVRKFDKDKLADLLMAVDQPESEHPAQSQDDDPHIIDTTEDYDVMGSGERNPKSLSCADVPDGDQRMQAKLLLAKMRQQGILPTTQASLVILQPTPQEAVNTAGPSMANFDATNHDVQTPVDAAGDTAVSGESQAEEQAPSALHSVVLQPPNATLKSAQSPDAGNLTFAQIGNTSNTLSPQLKVDKFKSMPKGREAVRAMYASMAAGGSSDESEEDQCEQKYLSLSKEHPPVSDLSHDPHVPCSSDREAKNLADEKTFQAPASVVDTLARPTKQISRSIAGGKSAYHSHLLAGIGKEFSFGMEGQERGEGAERTSGPVLPPIKDTVVEEKRSQEASGAAGGKLPSVEVKGDQEEIAQEANGTAKTQAEDAHAEAKSVILPVAEAKDVAVDDGGVHCAAETLPPSSSDASDVEMPVPDLQE